jgi:chloramphenicol 3-O phosphotransferase
MAKGQIIFLNGASSSGKSTLAITLQKALDKPYLYMSIDDHLYRFTKFISEYQRIGQSKSPTMSTVNQPQEFLRSRRLFSLIFQQIPRFHHAVAAKANSGNRVIVDHVLEQSVWLEECVILFDGLEVIFVGVHCPLEELERRAINRGDRPRGLSRYQYGKVHVHGIYDIELDTSTLTPEECASIIVEYVNSGSSPTAFEQLRQNFENRSE